MTRFPLLPPVLLPVLLPVLACQAPLAPDRTAEDALTGPLEDVFRVPDWPDREYVLHLPPAYDGTQAVPVVLAFHGGGGKKEGVNPTTCLDGEEGGEACLFTVADREGFAVVAPDGVDARGLRGRSWNSGGGEDGWRCVGGAACEEDSDDVAYTDALLDEIRRALLVDEQRIYATGISNGGSMSHRLACDRADVFAAVAPVAGANQALGWPGCTPSRPIPVLHVHGTEDPCWGYDGAIEESLCEDGTTGAFMDVPTSMAGWWERNGCTGTLETPLPDVADDGTSPFRVDGVGCAADTVHLRVDGGGHSWPGGWEYLAEDRIGRLCTDFSASEEIWAFFAAHPLSGAARSPLPGFLEQEWGG